MSKNSINSVECTPLSAQGLFDKGGEYLADTSINHGSDQAQHYLTVNSLHSENQSFQAYQPDIQLSDSSIDWIKKKFGKQDNIAR